MWWGAIQAGSGDGDGGNLICWMGSPWDGGGACWIGTPAGAVVIGLELDCGETGSCSGCCSGAAGTADAAGAGGCQVGQAGVVAGGGGSCS